MTQAPPSLRRGGVAPGDVLGEPVARARVRARRPMAWWVPLFVIGGELALIGALIRNSYYAADDWIMFSIAKSNGLSWKTVGFNLYNHFAPVEWLLHLLVQEAAPLDYAAGMAIILILCTGMLVALWWTLHVLEAPAPVVLGGLIVVGTSPFLVNSALWFGQAVFIPLFLTGMTLVVGFFVRWCRHGRRRDAIGAVLVFAASLSVGEIPLLVLPLLVIIRYVILSRPSPAQLPGAIWADRWVWAPFVVVAGVFAWFFHTYYYGPEPTPSVGQLIWVLAYGAVRLWRGTVGMPIVPAQAWLRVLSDVGVVATGVVVAFLGVRWPVVRRTAVFFAVYFVLKQIALGLGLAGKYGADFVTGDAQYYIDLMVVALLAVALATGAGWRAEAGFGHQGRAPAPGTGVPGGRARRAHRRRSAGAGIAGAAIVIVVVHAVATPFSLVDMVRGSASATQSRHYVQALRAGLAAVDVAPDHATVVPMLLPAYVAPAFIAPYNRQDVFLQLVPEWKAFDSGPVLAVSDQGALTPVDAGQSTHVSASSPAVALGGISRSTGPDGSSCFRVGAAPGTIVFTPPTALQGAPLVADIHLRVTAPFSAVPAAESGGSWAYAPLSTGTAAGDHRLVTWLPGDGATSVALSAIAPGTAFCVLGVQLGVMVAAADRSGTCHSLAIDGTTGPPAPCGRPWE